MVVGSGVVCERGEEREGVGRECGKFGRKR